MGLLVLRIGQLIAACVSVNNFTTIGCTTAQAGGGRSDAGRGGIDRRYRRNWSGR